MIKSTKKMDLELILAKSLKDNQRLVLFFHLFCVLVHIYRVNAVDTCKGEEGQMESRRSICRNENVFFC